MRVATYPSFLSHTFSSVLTHLRKITIFEHSALKISAFKPLSSNLCLQISSFKLLPSNLCLQSSAFNHLPNMACLQVQSTFERESGIKGPRTVRDLFDAPFFPNTHFFFIQIFFFSFVRHVACYRQLYPRPWSIERAQLINRCSFNFRHIFHNWGLRPGFFLVRPS